MKRRISNRVSTKQLRQCVLDHAEKVAELALAPCVGCRTIAMALLDMAEITPAALHDAIKEMYGE